MSRVICPTDTAVKTSSTLPPSDHRTHLLFNSRRPFADRSVLVVRGAAELRHVRNERVLLRVRDGWMDTVRTATLCGCRSHRRRRREGARSKEQSFLSSPSSPGLFRLPMPPRYLLHLGHDDHIGGSGALLVQTELRTDLYLDRILG